jgi:hypothetical protein
MVPQRQNLPGVPFPREVALNQDRLISKLSSASPSQGGPFVSNGTGDQQTTTHTIPGDPRVRISDVDAVDSFLSQELSTPILDDLHPWLWLLAKRSGDHIEPLHRQRLKERLILAAEDPGLHLIWRPGSIFVKPFPTFLGNYDFWSLHLSSMTTALHLVDTDASSHKELPPAARYGNEHHRAEALGLLRSYALLIRHPLDLAIAKEAHLIPTHIPLTWDAWVRFIAPFAEVTDEMVSPRYRFGQIRLNRLNWAVRLLQPKSARHAWYYERRHWSGVAWIQQSFPFLLFVFASMSLVLSSMQVALSVSGDDLGYAGTESGKLQPLERAFWIFAIVVVMLSAAIWAVLLTIPTATLLYQIIWSVIQQRKPTSAPAD